MAMQAASFGDMQRQLTANTPAKGYTARGGNQAIPEAMANALKSEVLLNTTVTGIRADANGAEVHCADGQIFRADRVICSLPCTVLRRIKLDPLLSGPQSAGVHTLQSQMINQLHLVAKTPFWEKDGMSPNMFTDSLAGMVIAEHKGEDPAEVTSLTVWLRGDRAAWADQVDTEVAISKVVEDLERLRPAAKGELEVMGYKSWYRDPYSSGDWAVFGPGQVTAFANELAKPHGRLHFCGEHTAVANRGLEGAMESGERVAIEVRNDQNQRTNRGHFQPAARLASGTAVDGRREENDAGRRSQRGQPVQKLGTRRQQQVEKKQGQRHQQQLEKYHGVSKPEPDSNRSECAQQPERRERRKLPHVQQREAGHGQQRNDAHPKHFAETGQHHGSLARGHQPVKHTVAECSAPGTACFRRQVPLVQGVLGDLEGAACHH